MFYDTPHAPDGKAIEEATGFAVHATHGSRLSAAVADGNDLLKDHATNQGGEAMYRGEETGPDKTFLVWPTDVYGLSEYQCELNRFKGLTLSSCTESFFLFRSKPTWSGWPCVCYSQESNQTGAFRRNGG